MPGCLGRGMTQFGWTPVDTSPDVATLSQDTGRVRILRGAVRIQAGKELVLPVSSGLSGCHS